MPLASNATLTFTSYAIEDNGIRLRFTCLAPGGGQDINYAIFLADSQLAAITTGAQFRTLVMTTLTRMFRGDSVAAKLDGFIGQSVTV